jgi:rod shape-determining protein MreC
MKKKNPPTYLFIFAAIFFLMSVPTSTSEKMRGSTIAFLAPLWENLQPLKIVHSPLATFSLFGKNSESIEKSKEELQKLRLENQLLHEQIVNLKEIVENESFLKNKIQEKQLQDHFLQTLNPLLKRRLKNLRKLFTFQLEAVPAKVIFRSASSWDSSLWLDVGESSNVKLGRDVVAKNSPVLSGTAVVGVIDYVGKNQCRVRLITDTGLNPSVRAVRNEDDLEKSQYLAKGELRGSSKPLWRSHGIVLKGYGFNYDFLDEEGPSRALISGKIEGSTVQENIQIIKIDDILITTGMDGVFPKGLKVAQVTKIFPLKEGDYSYEIEAKPLAENLDNLSVLYVMPPIGYNPFDLPPTLGR